MYIRDLDLQDSVYKYLEVGKKEKLSISLLGNHFTLLFKSIDESFSCITLHILAALKSQRQ